MMNFRSINAAIIDLLGDSAAGRFQVVGYQRQGRAAEDQSANRRTVQSYYSSGDFSRSSGRPHGSTQHAMDFTIGISVSSPAKVNLSVINSENAAPEQVAGALSALQSAAYLADTQFDDLAEIVYQILMDGRNHNLSFDKGFMTDRWVGQIRKDPPAPNGGLVVLTGSVLYSCSTCEDVVGDEGMPATEGIFTQLVVGGDNVGVTGVQVVPELPSETIFFENDSPVNFEEVP